MTSIRRASRRLARWERYLRRYRRTFGDPTVRSPRGHQRAWEALAAAYRGRCGRREDHDVCRTVFDADGNPIARVRVAEDITDVEMAMIGNIIDGLTANRATETRLSGGGS